MKSSKLKHTWEVYLDSHLLKIEVFDSKYSKKSKIFIDSELKTEIKKPQNGVFDYAVDVKQNILVISKKGAQFEVKVNETLFEDLPKMSPEEVPPEAEDLPIKAIPEEAPEPKFIVCQARNALEYKSPNIPSTGSFIPIPADLFGVQGKPKPVFDPFAEYQTKPIQQSQENPPNCYIQPVFSVPKYY